MHLKVDFYFEWPRLDMSVDLWAMLRLQSALEALSAASQSCDAAVCVT